MCSNPHVAEESAALVLESVSQEQIPTPSSYRLKSPWQLSKHISAKAQYDESL